MAVILILRGFETGLYIQSRMVVMDRGADLIATQAGVANFMAVRSTLPQLTRSWVESVAGVAAAHPMTSLPLIYNQDGKKTPLLLLVHDEQGGPRQIQQGSDIRDGRDVVIDIALAKKHGLQPGDPLKIAGFEFRIAGVTRQSSALFMPLVFTNYDGLIDFFLESEVAPDISTFPLLSFLLIDLEPGADPTAVTKAIEAQVVDADVLTPQQLANNDVLLGRALFGPVMGLLILVAYLIGTLVIGLIIYTDVGQRQHSLCVLKALGFGLARIASGILIQTLLLLGAAFPLGMLVALLVATLIEWWAPLYLVPVLEPVGLGKTLAGVMTFTLLGCLLPLRLLARADPVHAFQTG